MNRVSRPGGQPALHAAVTMGNREVVELLLAKGIDTGIVDDSNATARHIAEESLMPELAALIREAELRQKYRIPRRSSRAIAPGMDEEGLMLTGLEWERG